MMQAFRNAAKPVVYLITITFLSWMILDLSGITGKGGFFTKTSVGTINGEPVELRAYQAAVQSQLTQQQRASGTTLSLEENEKLRNDVWDSFIESMLINDQIQKNHVTTSPEEVVEWITNLPPPELKTMPDFQTGGTFDLSKYQRWLAGPVGQQYVPTFEAQTRDQILRTRLFSNITADIFLSDAALWQKYRDQNEKVKISLTPIIGRNLIADSAVTATEAEVQAYYKAHTAEFERPKTAFMHFVAVPRRIDASDSAAALERAKSLRADVTGGQAFDDVAKRESADTASARKGGDLGELTKGASGLSTAAEKAAFALAVNAVSEPVLDGAGYHLLQVTKKTTDKKDGDKITVRQILIPIELAGAHRTAVDAETDSLQKLAADRLDPAALDTVARALKRPLAETGPVAAGTRVALGPYVIPDVGIWAFEAKVGETSPVIDGEAASYVFRLDSMQQAGVPPLVQVHELAMHKVKEEKKKEKARSIAEDLIKQVNGGATLKDASTALKLPNREFDPFTRTTMPLENAQVVGTAFALPVGAVSGIIDTPDGLYIIKVLQRTPADSAQFVKDKDQYRSQEIKAVRNERVREFVASLRASAKIVDRRGDLIKTNAQTEAALLAQQGKTTR
jgi:peptidyl-prolyl cis-trans isomerase D